MKKELADKIQAILKGTKPTEHAKDHIDVANRRLNSPELHKSYDISGDNDSEKSIDEPGVEFDFDNDEDDLEYIKHKMGMDDPKEVHKSDETKDKEEKEPAKFKKNKMSFSDYAKNDEIRRTHLRMAKIAKVQE